MKRFILFSASISSLLLSADAQNIDRTCATCSRIALDSANLHINPVRVNQVGYRSVDPHKCAYVANPSTDQFSIVRMEDGETVYTGSLVSLGSYPELNGTIFIRGYYNSINPLYTLGDSVQTPGPNDLFRADFGDFQEDGTYQIVVGEERSLPFDIRPTIYNDVFETALKFFGINRCGDTKSWIHDACHVKDGSALGAEYAGRLSGGWHDCGDHGKYSETVAYTALVLAFTYAVLPQKAEDRYGESYNDTLPFGNDGIPDILWEAKVGADYIYKLYSVSKEQGLIEEADMYHSVGLGPGMDHLYWDVPENQEAQVQSKGGPDRPVTAGIGSNVAGMYAASLALFSWGWEPFDPEYAGRLREAAVDIYDNIIMKKIDSTTEMPCCYPGGGRTDDDEGMAAMALWFVTGEERFGYDLLENRDLNFNENAVYNMNEFEAGHMGNRSGFHAGGWTTDYEQVFPYALYGLAKLILPDDETAIRYGVNSERRQELMERILATMKYHISTGSNGSNNTKFPGINVDEPYHGVFTSVDWGYNRYNMGIVIELFMYWDLTGEESYYAVGMDNINYNLGMNPWDISFLTGAGSKNLNHPHNRASNPEGYNAGGIPYEYQPAKGAFMGGSKPGKVLIDEWHDYIVTETCIDYSAQLVFIAQLLAKDLPPDNEGPEFFNVVVDQVGRTSAIISWETNELSRDTLYYSLTPGGPIEGKIGADLSMKSSATLRNLAPNTTYYFYLEGMDVFRNVAKDNNKGQYYQFTTSDTEIPDAQITDVRICHVTHNSATVYWWTPNGPYPSAVEFSPDSANFEITKTLVDGDDEGKPVRFHKLTLQNLKPNTTYFVKVISGNTSDDNGGRYYKFTTTEVLVDYTVRIKPIDKDGTAHFYIEVANNEKIPYAGLELRFYFSADPITAASLTAKGSDNMIFGVTDIGGLNVSYSEAVEVDGMQNVWYFPITVVDTIPVAGRARIELRINQPRDGWDPVDFSVFEDA
ncbi:MAG: glycoside hydrolase family 9 protein, partial [Fibrobacterota bacterium]